MKVNTKKFVTFLLPTLMSSLVLAGCGESGSSVIPSSSNPGSSSSNSAATSKVEPVPFNGTDYYDKIAERVGYQANSEYSFDEKLSSGSLNDDLFWVIDGYWDAGGTTNWHNGVRARNLRYVKNGSDTYLGIKARGSYCQDSRYGEDQRGHIKPEGACIMTKNVLKARPL
jgi:hypothetical protein